MCKGGRKKNPKLKLGRFASWGLSGTGRVAGPHHLNADPDPSVHFNSDPDPSFHFNANPDPSHHRSDANRDHWSTDPHPRLHFVPLELLNFDFNADQDLHGSRSSWQSESMRIRIRNPGYGVCLTVKIGCFFSVRVRVHSSPILKSKTAYILFSSLILFGTTKTAYTILLFDPLWDNKDGL